MEKPESFEVAFAGICAMDGPLSARLSALSQVIRVFEPDFAAAYDELVANLKTGGAGRGAPGIGDLLPPFLLPDHNGHLADLGQLLAGGPLVISFNRGHWCEYCDLELRSFAEAHREFSALAANVAVIMPERAEYTRQVVQRNGNAFRVLSDIDNGYALELNLVVWLGEKLQHLLTGLGLDLVQYQGNSSWFVPIPATFVAGPGGGIVARFVDPDFRNRMAIEDVIAAVRTARE